MARVPSWVAPSLFRVLSILNSLRGNQKDYIIWPPSGLVNFKDFTQ